MKRWNLCKPRIVLLICLILGIIIIKHKIMIVEAQQKQIEIAIDYKWQNRAIPPQSGLLYIQEYIPFEDIDQKKLDVYLSVYNNSYLNNNSSLSLEDIQNYLEKEENEDGSLRLTNGYEDIKAYIHWYTSGGAAEIEDYWSKLEVVRSKYALNYPSYANVSVLDLSQEQIRELIKKERDSTYVMDEKIMGTQANQESNYQSY